MGRITVIDQAYYESAGRNIVSMEARSYRSVNSDEQAYGPRDMWADNTWQLVDYGWVEKPSCLIVRNLDSADESGHGKVLELAIADGRVYPCEDVAVAALLFPREALRVCPGPKARYYVRTKDGSCRYEVTAYPG